MSICNGLEKENLHAKLITKSECCLEGYLEPDRNPFNDYLSD